MLGAVLAELYGAQDELREFAQGVRPPLLGSGGLEAALPVLAARGTVPVHVDVAVGRLAPAIESAVYFVCAEGLTNVAKHAGARQAWVSVGVDSGDVVARVVDDGAGGVDWGCADWPTESRRWAGACGSITAPQVGPSSRRVYPWRCCHEGGDRRRLDAAA
jgi:hypothetical protein